MFGRDPLSQPEPLIRRVYSYVAYRIGDGVEAEDVTSETFERALRYRQSYDSSKGPPAAWLIGIARRIIDSRPAPTALVEDPPEIGSRDFEEAVVSRLTIAAAVSRLERRDRELIALRYGADLTARQIAELLGAKTNTIEVALHRALARLRAGLEDDGESGAAGRRSTDM